MKKLLLALLCGVLFVGAGAWADWAQYLGPDRNATSPETGLARSWPPAGPKVLWEVKLGGGFAGAAVRDGEVYLLDREDNARDIFRCFDLATGKELWRYAYDSPGEPGFPGSRTQPTVDEQYVYAVGIMGDFHCFDRKTHEVVWKHNLLTDFGSGTPTWGVAQAPSLYKDLVVVAAQAAGALVVAYKRDSGEVAWTSEGFGGPGYVSPRLATLAGVDQAVMVTAGDDGGVTGVSLANGDTLWRYTNWTCKIPIVSPTPLPGDRVFITGEYGSGSAMLQVVKDGDGVTVKELYKTDLCGSQIHQPILFEDHLYMNSNGNRRRDGMTCMTLDGERKWNTGRRPGFERGNLILADGMIYNLDGESGLLHLIEPSPEGYQELASAQVLEGDGKMVWAPMALSNGKLLVRDQNALRCLDVKNP